MYLYQSRKLFEDLIIRTAEYFSLSEEIIEKDYFVSLFLKRIAEANPNIVFKGGTSLSKAYQLIERFSEDIDLSYFIKDHGAPSQSKRKELTNTIRNVASEMSLKILNEDEIRSRNVYNRYNVDYSSLFNRGDQLKSALIIETYAQNSSFPVNKKDVSNYIFQMSSSVGISELAKDFPELFPFKMNVQTLERTFADKIFALCDHYMIREPKHYSRHLYDLYYLFQKESIDWDSFSETFEEVRLILQKDLKRNPSSNQTININNIISQIMKEDFYKADYELSTMYLATNAPKYEEVKRVLLSINNRLI